jgi:hypothetical protein
VSRSSSYCNNERVTIAAVGGVRRAVARPSARTGLIVTAAVWVITRVPMYLIDTGRARDHRGALYVGDVMTYEKWLRFFAGGRFPAGDPSWQYPPGAAAVLSVPHLLPGHYLISFLWVELLCDLVIAVVLAH